jgi:hypothetical protein
MKKLVFIGLISLLISACSTTRDAGISRAEKRLKAKAAELADVKKAVESRRYIIKMDRIYMTRGGYLDLVPRKNYIIVDGELASISLGYVGGSVGRPVTGINLNGHTTKYTLESNEAKGVYNVNMEVKFQNSRFDLYLTIGSSGTCSVSLINGYIQAVNYSGHLVPISESVPGNSEKTDPS